MSLVVLSLRPLWFGAVESLDVFNVFIECACSWDVARDPPFSPFHRIVHPTARGFRHQNGHRALLLSFVTLCMSFRALCFFYSKCNSTSTTHIATVTATSTTMTLDVSINADVMTLLWRHKMTLYPNKTLRLLHKTCSSLSKYFSVTRKYPF